MKNLLGHYYKVFPVKNVCFAFIRCRSPPRDPYLFCCCSHEFRKKFRKGIGIVDPSTPNSLRGGGTLYPPAFDLLKPCVYVHVCACVDMLVRACAVAGPDCPGRRLGLPSKPCAQPPPVSAHPFSRPQHNQGQPQANTSTEWVPFFPRVFWTYSLLRLLLAETTNFFLYNLFLA